MRFFLFLLFPFLEVFLFIQIADEMGYGWAFLGLVISFFLGLNLFRFIGAQGARNIMQSLAASGANAPREMGGVMAKLAAAVLLMIPGYLTDVIALLLLLPVTRSLLMLFFLKRAMKSRNLFSFQMNGFATGQSGQNPFGKSSFRQNSEDVIEGEATEVKTEKSQIQKKN